MASNEWQCSIRQEELFDDNNDCDVVNDCDEAMNTRSRGGKDFYLYDEDDDEVLLTKVCIIFKSLGIKYVQFRQTTRNPMISFVNLTMMNNKNEIQIML